MTSTARGLHYPLVMTSFVRLATLSILGGAVALAACSSSSNLGTPGDGGVGGEGGPGPVVGVPTQHIPSGATCRATRGPGNSGNGFTCADGGFSGCCGTDADCTDGTNGRCTITGNGGPHCTYDVCSSSSDCPTGNSCACGDVNAYSYNICVPSNCRTDSDCGTGGYCSPSLGTCGTYGGEYAGIYCHTAQDQCVNDSDCAGPNGHCSYNLETSRWECSSTVCAG